MEFDVQLDAFEPLAPILPYLVGYLLLLLFLRVILWPFVRGVMRRGTLRKLIVRTVWRLLLLAAGLLLLASTFWVVASLGLAEPLFEYLLDLGDIAIPRTDISFPFYFLLLGLAALLVLGWVMRPAYRRVRR